MQGNTKNYLDSIAGDLPPEIISEDTYSQIYKMAASFSDFAASEYIMETHLNTEAAEADFSFRVLAEEKRCLSNGVKKEAFLSLAADEIWTRIINFIDLWSGNIGDIWFEMDSGEYGKTIPRPCFFFNASQIKKGPDVDEKLLFDTLELLVDHEQLQLLWPKLQGVIYQLPSEAGLFQVGVMMARNSDRVRVFTAELSREQTINYLSAIGWKGSFDRLEELFQLVHSYSDGQYILDFDVSSEGISEKIGINFGLERKETLADFLDKLMDHQLCKDLKKTGVLAWSGSKGSFLGQDYGYTALIKDLSHFKIGCSPDEGLKAKAYLRVAGIYMKDLFKAQASIQIQLVQDENKREPPRYKEMQDVFKEIAKKSMLDKEYRALCLRDSKAAIQKIVNFDAALPDNIVFLEEDGDGFDRDAVAYILPPFLKPSWLTSK